MRNTMWRLAALGGMIGLGLLFVLQAKQGWKNPLHATPVADSERGDIAEFDDGISSSSELGQTEQDGLGRPNPLTEEDDPFANARTRTPSVAREMGGHAPPAQQQQDLFDQSEPAFEQSAPTSVPVRRPRRSAAVAVEEDPFAFAEAEEPVEKPAVADPSDPFASTEDETASVETASAEFGEEGFNPDESDYGMESAEPVVAALAGVEEPVSQLSENYQGQTRPEAAYSRKRNSATAGGNAPADAAQQIQLVADVNDDERPVRVPFPPKRPQPQLFAETEEALPIEEAPAETQGEMVAQADEADPFAMQDEAVFDSGVGTVDSSEDSELFPDDAKPARPAPKTQSTAPVQSGAGQRSSPKTGKSKPKSSVAGDPFAESRATTKGREPRVLPEMTSESAVASEIGEQSNGNNGRLPLVDRGPAERFEVEEGPSSHPLDAAGNPSTRKPRTAASISGDSVSQFEEDPAIVSGEEHPVEVPRKIPSSQQRPQLTIEKVAPQNAVLGQPLVYRIVVKNVGTSPARQVIVEDEIPEGVKLTGTIPRAELAGKRLIWRLGTVDPDTDRTILIRVVPTSEGEIGSVATVNFVAEVASQTRITAPRLKLTLSAQPQVALGDEIVVNFSVTNSGTGDATKVVIRDLLPAALEHPGGDDLEYAVGDLPAGETREVELSLKAVQPGVITNRATVTADGGLSEEAELEILVVGSQLNVKRSGPRQQFLNRTGEFVNVVSNPGKRPATGVAMVETLGTGFEFVQASNGGVYDSERGTVTWQLGTIPAGKAVETRVVLKSRVVGTQSTSVLVTDSTGGESSAASDTQVQGLPSLSVQVAEMPMPVAVGEQFPCRVTLKNRGSDVAGNSVLNLVLPAELKLVDAEGATGHRLNGNRVQFEAVEALEPGESLVFEVTLQATAPGDSRLSIQYQANHMQKPLTREEGVFVVAGSR